MIGHQDSNGITIGDTDDPAVNHRLLTKRAEAEYKCQKHADDKQ